MEPKKDIAREQRAHSNNEFTSFLLKFSKLKRCFERCRQEYGKHQPIESPDHLQNILQSSFGLSLTPDEVSELFVMADLDHNLQITFREFLITLACTSVLGVNPPETNNFYESIFPAFNIISDAFQLLDRTKQGWITHERIRESGIFDENIINERITELDYNADHKISFQEFVYCISNWVDVDEQFNEEEDGTTV